MIEIVIKNGYTKLEYGWRKTITVDDCVIDNYITFFGDNRVQLFAYYSNNDEEKLYDTSIVEMTPEILQIFINTLVK